MIQFDIDDEDFILGTSPPELFVDTLFVSIESISLGGLLDYREMVNIEIRDPDGDADFIY